MLLGSYPPAIGRAERQLVVQRLVQQRFVHLDSVAVVDKAERAKAIHEEAHPGSASSRSSLPGSLAKSWGDIVRLLQSCLSPASEECVPDSSPGVEELVDKIGLQANGGSARPSSDRQSPERRDAKTPILFRINAHCAVSQSTRYSPIGLHLFREPSVHFWSRSPNKRSALLKRKHSRRAN